MEKKLVTFSCLAFCVSMEMTDGISLQQLSNLMIVIYWCSCFSPHVPNNSGAIFESYFKMRAGSVPS